MAVKSIPSSEDGYGVVIKTENSIYIVSQNTAKGKFTLWKETSSGYEKIATADSPLKLYEKVK